MKVKLTYFRVFGKYYGDAEYTSELKPGTALYVVWDAVEIMREARTLPGLVEGHDEYIVLVDVPEHPHNHPVLLVPKRFGER
jgi:hypothetical protein